MHLCYLQTVYQTVWFYHLLFFFNYSLLLISNHTQMNHCCISIWPPSLLSDHPYKIYSRSSYLHRLMLCDGKLTVCRNTNKHLTTANFEGLRVKFLQCSWADFAVPCWTSGGDHSCLGVLLRRCVWHVYVSGMCQSNIYTNGGIQGFPVEHCIKTRLWMLHTSPACS